MVIIMTNDTMKKLAVLLDTTEEKLNIVLDTLDLMIVEKKSTTVNTALEKIPESESASTIGLTLSYFEYFDKMRMNYNKMAQKHAKGFRLRLEIVD